MVMIAIYSFVSTIAIIALFAGDILVSSIILTGMSGLLVLFANLFPFLFIKGDRLIVVKLFFFKSVHPITAIRSIVPKQGHFKIVLTNTYYPLYDTMFSFMPFPYNMTNREVAIKKLL